MADSKTCENCAYWERNTARQWTGWCGVKLPPVLQQLTDPSDRIVRADDGCDLHRELEA